ncbi:MAG TPA: NUDIX domain-containing protein [Gaiellaceae bacterium]
MTGFDELLVFDFPGAPEFSAVVPGGGIEEGETVEETAIREVLEETGIEARFVREVGVAEDPIGHYVQLVPTERLPETWEHMREDGPVLCRWAAVSAELDLWGLRGDFVHALVRKRVVGYVTRGRKLLVFEHAGTTQLPAGRVDHDETLVEGLVREVEEETGVAGVRVVSELADAAEFARLFGPAAHESHAFHALTDAETPGTWTHQITGTGMDSGISVPCRWVALDERPLIWGKADPLVDRLRMSITDG